MKRLLFAASMLAAVMMTIGAFSTQATTETKKTERATIQFNEPVKLLNVFLKGEYTFVHDEEKMAKGEDCTYVYNASGKLIVSFHCIPAQRAEAKNFRVLTVQQDRTYGPREIKEYQFAGSTEAHQVP
ncbi:MAG TPA: hypothetical protein VLM38_21255 [Blastocatellia bacterium]|nr:hypothetical protein [Blastocatellia bacterium]